MVCSLRIISFSILFPGSLSSGYHFFLFFSLCQGVIRVHYICKDILGVRGGRCPPSPPSGSASAWRPSTQELSLALILDLSPIISSHHPPPPHPFITDNAFNQRSTRILIYKQFPCILLVHLILYIFGLPYGNEGLSLHYS